jgi:hypothetical protein
LPTPPTDNIQEVLAWVKLLVAAIGGGFVVKLLDIGYLEIRRRSDKRRSSTRFVDQHLDPLLKAADELVGKLLSLGKEDFKSFAEVDNEVPFEHSDFASTAYLIARFWAQIEILRKQALYVSISEDERGYRLQKFVDCMESRGVRLLDRISQRAVGETLIAESGTDTIRYIDWANKLIVYDEDGKLVYDEQNTEWWLTPLKNLLMKATHTKERQQLLQYGVVVHAMIDTLDIAHSITRDRPAIPNKLSERTWRDLNYRVFKDYLTFVHQPEKYFGRPKTRAADKAR